MKLTCCCLTCIIGEDEKQNEEERLLPEENEDQRLLPDTDESKQPAVSPSKVFSDTEIENDEATRKAAGVLKKYNVTSSKSDLKRRITEEGLVSSNIDLKISIKIMARSDAVKIFALEASNVMTVLQAKNQDDSKLQSLDEPTFVQIRTKLLPTESRSHSKKYQVSESITGAMKFSNECLHTLTVTEFQSRSIRFRLYYVLKHQRDILLGEYILDAPNLNLEIESGVTNILMQLHEPSAASVKPPEISDKRKSIGSTARNDSQSSTTSIKALRSTIRRGDLKHQTRVSVTSMFDNDDESMEGKFRSVFSPPVEKSRTLSPLEEYSDGVSPEHKTRSGSPLEKLKKAVEERTENLAQLDHATEDLAVEAGTFSEVSTRLREKYEKKSKRKKRF